MPTPYTIRPGDTLSALASRYHTSVGALQVLNHIADANRIRVGQLLEIPDGFEPASGRYVVQRGDTLGGIAREVASSAVLAET